MAGRCCKAEVTQHHVWGQDGAGFSFGPTCLSVRIQAFETCTVSCLLLDVMCVQPHVAQHGGKAHFHMQISIHSSTGSTR